MHLSHIRTHSHTHSHVYTYTHKHARTHTHTHSTHIYIHTQVLQLPSDRREKDARIARAQIFSIRSWGIESNTVGCSWLLLELHRSGLNVASTLWAAVSASDDKSCPRQSSRVLLTAVHSLSSSLSLMELDADLYTEEAQQQEYIKWVCTQWNDCMCAGI